MKIIFKKTLEEIIEGCKRGDRKCQRLLYDKFAPKMLMVCRRYASNSDEADDILQDGFIRAFDKIGQFEGTGAFEGWLRRLIVNVALRHCQMKKAVSNMDDIDDLKEDIEDEIPQYEFDMNELLQMIDLLPPGYKAVFNMFAIDDFSHKEIADMLGITVNTSKSQLARARGYLQKLISEKRYKRLEAEHAKQAQ